MLVVTNDQVWTEYSFGLKKNSFKILIRAVSKNKITLSLTIVKGLF